MIPRRPNQNAPHSHATHEKRAPAKTQCFRRFFGRGRRTCLGCRLGCCSPVGSAQHRPKRQLRPVRSRAPPATSAPRHAVLEWMWEDAPGSGERPVFPGSPEQVPKEWCWFGASRDFRKRKDIVFDMLLVITSLSLISSFSKFTLPLQLKLYRAIESDTCRICSCNKMAALSEKTNKI